jgi:hypothetical protein
MAGTVYHAYCDESSIGGDDFMVLGGIMVAASVSNDISLSMDAWRAKRGLASHEIKWAKTGKGTIDRYKDIVSATMRRIDSRELAFRSVVFEASKIDYCTFHEGDKDKAYNRFLFDLLFYCMCPLVPRDARMLIYVDKRKEHQSLAELQRILNSMLRTRLGFRLPNPVRSIEPRCSKTENFLQINDLLLGAVGYHNNCRGERPDAQPPKKLLAQHVADLASLPHMKLNTPPEMTHFGVWQHQLKRAP